MENPEIVSVRRVPGVAGQFAYDVRVKYDGEPNDSRLQFVGNAFGGPIVMVLGSGVQVFVANPERFGPKLTREWVRNFLTTQV